MKNFIKYIFLLIVIILNISIVQAKPSTIDYGFVQNSYLNTELLSRKNDLNILTTAKEKDFAFIKNNTKLSSASQNNNYSSVTKYFSNNYLDFNPVFLTEEKISFYDISKIPQILKYEINQRAP